MVQPWCGLRIHPGEPFGITSHGLRKWIPSFVNRFVEEWNRVYVELRSRFPKTAAFSVVVGGAGCYCTCRVPIYFAHLGTLPLPITVVGIRWLDDAHRINPKVLLIKPSGYHNCFLKCFRHIRILDPIHHWLYIFICQRHCVVGFPPAVTQGHILGMKPPCDNWPTPPGFPYLTNIKDASR